MPGIQRAYIFNKKDVLGGPRDSCGGKPGYVYDLTFCSSYTPCGYIIEFEQQTGRQTQADTTQGQSTPTALAFEGTIKILNCEDQATLESLYGGEYVVIILDNGGVWRIAGQVGNLPGFRFSGIQLDLGAAAGDTIVSTLRFEIASIAAKTGGWKLFLAGSESDSFEVRKELTAQWIRDHVCSISEATNDCGCAGE